MTSYTIRPMMSRVYLQYLYKMFFVIHQLGSCKV